MEGQDLREKTINKLLKENNPCKICLVQASCRKSFTRGSACEELAEKLEEALKRESYENKT